ncbi:MAG TPA: YceI family protein [Chryseosolibacter sp.]
MLKLSLVGILLVAGLTLRAQVTYRLSGNNGIQIAGTSTLSDWTVASREVGGEMTFTPSKKGTATTFRPGVIRDAKATLQVSSIKSEKGETMDAKMYKALKGESHPEIIFVLTKPLQVSRSAGTISAAGNLEIAGVTRPMMFELDLTCADGNFHLEGSKNLRFSDFEIDPPTAMFGQIVTGDEISVKLDLTFVRDTNQSN